MKKIAVYPGTFDPITNGHIDIARKASQIFDEVIISVAEVTGKNTLFSLEDRERLCRESTIDIPNIKVTTFDGLSVEFCKKMNATAILRGLRAVSDFEYELQIALMNHNLEKDLNTVFLIPDYKFLYLSSSMVRQIVKLGGELKDFIPECVEAALKKKFF